mmetsp:Transcript_45042/g.54139  ORF Transcript_45042/g.54139 Transcript_45042/m.54139 type:complete len:103 (-) Transcript_45042:103-411(-)|eukprot:CAMPEP_0194357686 /NCGR_PEP_ID=MMETSP0174-20130528/5137_1 /TAXON_ID=216777 /ORGANISM="Proboscia alata, Strain PI-D3" /LENGTH=102 /DNA_ID=CAMNT_0039127809 /DNA_START=56 /DNA_END=364 /DNA_ORIENTATION=+
MHPPLERSHPDCQETIENLRLCHASNSKFRFWACNDAKFELDKCFRKEKKDMLERMNERHDMKEIREAEAKYMGRMSFEETWKIEKENMKKGQGRGTQGSKT